MVADRYSCRYVRGMWKDLFRSCGDKANGRSYTSEGNEKVLNDVLAVYRALVAPGFTCSSSLLVNLWLSYNEHNLKESSIST